MTALQNGGRRRAARAAAVALTAIVGVLGGGVSAQQPMSSLPGSTSDMRLPGWSFVPTVVYSGSWDDNVLIKSEGDATTGDFLSVVNPRGALDFTGRRGQFGLSYDGAFLRYRKLDSLDSFDQHGAIHAERQVSKRVMLFVRDNAAIVPTTDTVEFIDVPFLRTGSRLNDLHAGMDVALSKYTTVTGSYNAQWVHFDNDNTLGTLLRGGHSQGGSLALKRRVSERATITADADMQHAVFGHAIDAFDLWNSSVGMEYRLTEMTHVYGAVGVSHLNVNSFGPARTGPSWRVGASRAFREAGLDVSYSRQYVPSYGFGGTTQNEDLTGRGRLPLGSRLYAQSAVSWRRNEPLTPGELKLTSWWIEGAVGYGLSQWLRLEAFYNGVRQKIDQPGGTLDRNRIGFQVIASKPMRLH